MRAPDPEAAKLMRELILKAARRATRSEASSNAAATGLPRGLGEPVFEGLDALLGGAALSIPGVKGVEFGLGSDAADMRGGDYLDAAEPSAAGAAAGGMLWRSNRAGGVAGGLSTGAELVLRVAVGTTHRLAPHSVGRRSRPGGDRHRNGTARRLPLPAAGTGARSDGRPRAGRLRAAG